MKEILIEDFESQLDLNSEEKDMFRCLYNIADGQKITIKEIKETLDDDNLRTETADSETYLCEDEALMEEALSEFGFDGCGKTIHGVKTMAGYIQARDTINEVMVKVEYWLEENGEKV